jgi:Ca2+-binding EF-hand superfamily protein
VSEWRVTGRSKLAPKHRVTKEFEEDKEWIISWSVLEQRALEFISVKHLRFLENFNIMFRGFDTDNDGRLSEEQFRNLVRKIELITNKSLDVGSLLLKLDPANTRFVNYSGIVFVLSNEFLELTETDLQESGVDRFVYTL